MPPEPEPVGLRIIKLILAIAIAAGVAVLGYLGGP
jgi:hypothetical protein